MRAAILFLLAAVICTDARSQGGDLLLSYPITFPTGNLHGYTNNVSFRGISFEMAKRTSAETNTGLEVGWNVFYQHVDKKVYQEGSASVTGVQYRYTNAVPLIFGTRYYAVTHSNAVHPFMGIGMGTTYINRTTNFGLYQVVTDSWQFAIRPELGLDFPNHHGGSLFIAAKYFLNFNTTRLDGQPWFSLNIGLRGSSH
jgi:hypothetical protein